VPKAAQEFLSLPLDCKQKNAKLTASCVKLANWGKLKRESGPRDVIDFGFHWGN